MKKILILCFILCPMLFSISFGQQDINIEDNRTSGVYKVSEIEVNGSDLWGTYKFNNSLFTYSSDTLYVFNDTQQQWKAIYNGSRITKVKAYNNQLYVLINTFDGKAKLLNLSTKEEILIDGNVTSRSAYADFIINRDNIYVTLAAYDSIVDHRIKDDISRQTIIRSTDFGMTWHPYDSGIMTNAVFTIDSTASGKIVVGGLDGIYLLNNDTWKKIDCSINNQIIHTLSIYEHQGKEAIFASTHEGLFVIGLTSKYEHNYPWNYPAIRINIFEDKGYILTSNWVEGLYVFDLTANNYDLSKLERKNFVQNVVYPFETTLYKGQIHMAGFSGYLASLFIDPKTGDYEIANNGIKGASGARTALVYKEEVLALLNNGLLKFNKDGSNERVEINYWPMHEPWRISKRKGKYYFYDYAIGLWETEDFQTLNRIKLKDRKGQPLKHYGGSAYYITEDMKYLYLATCKEIEGDAIGYYVFDWVTKKLLYQFDVPDFIYGWQAHMYISKSNEAEIYIELQEGYNGLRSIYYSADRGKTFRKLFEHDIAENSVFMLDGQLHYVSQGKLFKYNTVAQKEELVKDFFTTKGVKVFGEYLISLNRSKNQIDIYDTSTFSSIKNIPYTVDLNGLWGMDILEDYLVITANDFLVLTVNKQKHID